jgi:hypothetical protein
MDRSRIITRILIGIIIVLAVLFLIQAGSQINTGSGGSPGYSTPGYYYHNTSNPDDEPPEDNPNSSNPDDDSSSSHSVSEP